MTDTIHVIFFWSVLLPMLAVSGAVLWDQFNNDRLRSTVDPPWELDRCELSQATNGENDD